MRRALALSATFALGAAPAAAAPRWDDVTAQTIGVTAEWTSKVELADLDGDGWVDIVFANGGDYATAGTPEPQRVFRNLGNWSGSAPHFEEISGRVFGGAGTRLSRVIKVRDVDGDGDLDVFVGGAHGTTSALFVQGPAGTFTDASAQLPAGPVSLGDAEFGDVDGDGDLDLVLADWGGPPFEVAGGPVRLWLNDGHGQFSDATARLPAVTLGMSWDLELVDIDNDGDLDVLVSSKLSAGGRAFVNDGAGHFTDESAARLPQRTNNYQYAAMDIDGDGDLDLVTINDGPELTETVLVNDGAGHFTDETAARLAGTSNPIDSDDNVAVFLDADNDGDADVLIGSLSDADRLLVNDGHGRFVMDATVLASPATPGTLGLAVADLDHDGRLDVVMSQGETASPDYVFRGNASVAQDTRPPVVQVLVAPERPGGTVIARIHDHASPGHDVDGKTVAIEIEGEIDGAPALAMRWRGEYEWAAALPDGTTEIAYRVCASDAAGNRGCSDPQHVMGAHARAGGCQSGGGAPSLFAALGLAMLLGHARGRSRRLRADRRRA